MHEHDERIDQYLVGGEDAASGAGWETLIAARVSVEDAVEARRALELLAALPSASAPRPRPVRGRFRYEEIARVGGRGRSQNNVNKQLTKARARIRRLEADAP